MGVNLVANHSTIEQVTLGYKVPVDTLSTACHYTLANTVDLF